MPYVKRSLQGIEAESPTSRHDGWLSAGQDDTVVPQQWFPSPPAKRLKVTVQRPVNAQRLIAQEPRDASEESSSAMRRVSTPSSPDLAANRLSDHLYGYDSLDSDERPGVHLPRTKPNRHRDRLSKTEWEKLMREDDFDQMLDEVDLDDAVDDEEGGKDFSLDDEGSEDEGVETQSDVASPRRRSARVEYVSTRKLNARSTVIDKDESAIMSRKGKRKRPRSQVEAHYPTSSNEDGDSDARSLQLGDNGTGGPSPSIRPHLESFKSKLLREHEHEHELDSDDDPDEVPFRAQCRAGRPEVNIDKLQQSRNDHGSTLRGPAEQPEAFTVTPDAQDPRAGPASRSTDVGKPFPKLEYTEPEGDDEKEFHFRLRQLELDRQRVYVELEQYRWQKRTAALAAERLLRDGLR